MVMVSSLLQFTSVNALKSEVPYSYLVGSIVMVGSTLCLYLTMLGYVTTNVPSIDDRYLVL